MKPVCGGSLLAKRNGYAVELSFDAETERAVRQVWGELQRAGVDDFMSHTGAHPHISLAVYDSVDDEALAARRLAEFARSVAPVPITLSCIGVFPGGGGVIFFGAVVTDELLRVHDELHRAMGDVGQGAWPYYATGAWVPHCTLTQDMPGERIAAAVDIARVASLPLRGTLVCANFVKFRPPSVLFSAPLAGSGPVLPATR